MVRSLVIAWVVVVSVGARAQEPAPVAAPNAAVAAAVEPAAPAAEAAAPSECTTTTTVTTRCTGAAAPYGAHAATAPVVAAPVLVTPSPSAPAAGPPMLVLDPALVSGQWHLVHERDGSWWRVREVRRHSPGLTGFGASLLIASYLAAGIGGSMRGNPIGWLPMLGPMLGGAFDGGSTARALWIVDSLGQVGGLVTMIVGLATGPLQLERHLVVLQGGPIPGGGAIQLSGRF